MLREPIFMLEQPARPAAANPADPARKARRVNPAGRPIALPSTPSFQDMLARRAGLRQAVGKILAVGARDRIGLRSELAQETQLGIRAGAPLPAPEPRCPPLAE